MKVMADRELMVKAMGFGVAFCLAGCNSFFPPRDTTALDAINAEMKKASTGNVAAPVPEAVSSSLLPPLKTDAPRASKRQLEQRFDLVVTDAPITQVLMGLVHGTKYSIMVKPKVAIPRAPVVATATGTPAVQAVEGLEATERVTINLKNVTIFEALDSIREVYGYDYTLDGNRIYVSQPELQTRMYQVNYIIGQRRGVSDLQVVGGASVGASAGGGSSSSSSSTTGASTTPTTGIGGFSSIQASGLSTMAKSDVWAEVEDALRTTLGCQVPDSVFSATSGVVGAGGSGGGGGGSSSSSSAGASRADVRFAGDTRHADRKRGVDGCTDGRSMSVSQMSGTIMVRGMPNEHRAIEKMLKALQMNIERQVIIEAKVIDVQLNSGSQQGINWADFSHGLHRASMGATPSQIGTNQPAYQISSAGIAYSGAVSGPSATYTVVPSNNSGGNMTGNLASTLGTAMMGSGNAFAAGLGIALQFRNFAALINFLETQGEVHVLSSPRIATLNSQKAVIKVGTEEPYVSNIIPGSSVVAAGSSSTVATSASLNYQPFFSGISLDVTPKVDDKGDITLHVHALVNSISERDKVASPDANAVRVPFAVNTINQTDSVVKAKDGQVIVIGGLMTESVSDNRGKTPGIGDAPGLGALFSKGSQTKIKRELVILLRPTVVVDDSVWNKDVSDTQSRIEAIGAAGAFPVPAESR